jgi:DeoR family glycerol-3-phosphate regulon repressor
MEVTMKPVVRQAKIANIIRQQNRVTVNELAQFLEISKETIRRDLTALAKAGKIQKFHGGAFLPSTSGEGPFRERMGENVMAKIQIATEAVKLVRPGETLFIDTGSTSLYFAEKLAEVSDLTVITNSAEIARIISLSSRGSQAFLVGGKFIGGNRQTAGSLAISQIQFFRAHHAVLTISAMDSQTGAMDFSIEEAQIAQAMIDQSQSLTIIADHSKFGRIASFKVCDLEQIRNLVCDQMPPEKIKSVLLKSKVNIINVAP